MQFYISKLRSNKCHMSESRNNKRMEDRMCVIDDLGTYIRSNDFNGVKLFSIFDGHDGYYASNFLKTFIPWIFEFENKDLGVAVKDALAALDSAYLEKGDTEGTTQGSTALVALLDTERRLHVAWLGDCEAHLVSKDNKFVKVVHPHKLSDQSVFFKGFKL